MFCPNCGKYLDDRSTFCTGCQQDIVPESSAQEPQPQQQYHYQSSQSSSAGGRPQYSAPSYSNQRVNVDSTNMIILSIFTTLCCCLPFGAIALFFAATASSAATQSEADSKMKNAKTFNIIAVVLGILIWIIYLIFNILPFLMMGGGTY